MPNNMREDTKIFGQPFELNGVGTLPRGAYTVMITEALFQGVAKIIGCSLYLPDGLKNTKGGMTIETAPIDYAEFCERHREDALKR